MTNRNVIPITRHPHFADYAELPVVPINRKGSRHVSYLNVGLAILAVCVVLAAIFVEYTWNY
jgi:hypothetical protein